MFDLFYFGFYIEPQHCAGHITTGSFMGRGNKTYSWSRFCTVICGPSESNYQLSNKSYGVEPLTSDLSWAILKYTYW